MTERTDHPSTTSGPQLVLHEERLQVGTERVAVEQVLLRKVIVTETRQVEVTVRREELHIERIPTENAAAARSSAAAEGPLVIVLAQEVPVVQLRTQRYEKVTVHIDEVTEHHQIDETVSHERADVTMDPHAPMS